MKKEEKHKEIAGAIKRHLSKYRIIFFEKSLLKYCLALVLKSNAAVVLFLLLLSPFAFADEWTSSLASHQTLYADTITSKTGGSPVRIADSQGLYVTGNVGIGTSPGSRFHVAGTNIADLFRVDSTSSDCVAFGGGPNCRFFVNIGGAGGLTWNSPATGANDQVLLYVRPAGITTSTGNTGDVKALEILPGTFTATDGAHSWGIGAAFNAPSKGGVGTFNNMATIHISGAPTGGGSNYALYSASGLNYFGGNVGIGTASPSDRLQVLGDIRITGSTASSGADYATLRVTDSQTGGVEWDIHSGYPSAGDFTIRQGNNDLRALTIKKDSGNVGIGTTAPAAVLHVLGSIRANNDADRSFGTVNAGTFFGSTKTVTAGAGATTLKAGTGSEGSVYLVSGFLPPSNRFTDLVLYSGTISTPVVISSNDVQGSPGARTYSRSAENFRVAISGTGDYFIYTTGFGGDET